MISNKLRQETEDLNRKLRFIHGAKVYPNEPCPCGSGKKFKKCCGKLEDRNDSTLIKDIQEGKYIQPS